MHTKALPKRKVPACAKDWMKIEVVAAEVIVDRYPGDGTQCLRPWRHVGKDPWRDDRAVILGKPIPTQVVIVRRPEVRSCRGALPLLVEL